MSLSHNAGEFSNGLRGDGAALRARLAAAMRRVAAFGHKRLANFELSGNALKARTGNTKRAVFDRVQGPEDNPSAVIGIDTTFAPGARINDEGGTITPKNGLFLTIPLAAVLTGKGVARFTARQVIQDPQAFGYVGTYFKKGVLFGYAQKSKKDFIEPVVPLFALKPSVTIPAKHFMASTLASTKDYAEGQVLAALAPEGEAHGG